MITVPKVNGQAQDPDAPVVQQRETGDPIEVRQGRSNRLAQILAVLAQLPPDERAREQMKLLAYPEAWRKGSWAHDDETAAQAAPVTEESETYGSA